LKTEFNLASLFWRIYVAVTFDTRILIIFGDRIKYLYNVNKHAIFFKSWTLRYKETREFIEIVKILYVISKKTGDYSLNLNIFPKNEMPNTNQWMQKQVC
jgi:hypothetical protein